jgi:hypothetical protein
MNPQEDVLSEVISRRRIRDRPVDHGKHQVLVSIDELVKGPDLAAAAAFDELALVARVHQPMLVRAGGGKKCFTMRSETIQDSA